MPRIARSKMCFRLPVNRWPGVGKKMTQEARDEEAEELLNECLGIPKERYKANGSIIAEELLAHLLIQGCAGKNRPQEENELFINKCLEELPLDCTLRLQESLSLQKIKEQPNADLKTYEEALWRAHEEEMQQGEESDLTFLLDEALQEELEVELDSSSSDDDIVVEPRQIKSERKRLKKEAAIKRKQEQHKKIQEAATERTKTPYSKISASKHN